MGLRAASVQKNRETWNLFYVRFLYEMCSVIMCRLYVRGQSNNPMLEGIFNYSFARCLPRGKKSGVVSVALKSKDVSLSNSSVLLRSSNMHQDADFQPTRQRSVNSALRALQHQQQSVVSKTTSSRTKYSHFHHKTMSSTFHASTSTSRSQQLPRRSIRLSTPFTLTT